MTARPIIATLAIALLATAGVRAAVVGTSGSLVFDAGMLLDSGVRLLPEQIVQLRQELNSVSDSTPWDPTLHEILGIVKLRAGELGARREFEQAVALRPVSAVSWTNVAEQHYREGDTGPMFRAALLNAIRLGPNEPVVQASVSNVGLAMWKELTAGDRSAVEKVVAAGVRRDPRGFLQIAGRRGRLDVACRHFIPPPRQAEMKWTRTCESVEATS